MSLANIRYIFVNANLFIIFMTNFGKNIKKIRSIQKLSQTKFAEIFDLSRASVGAYEEGRAEPKLEVITTIAKYFSITVDDLVNSEITVNKLYHFNIFDTKFGNKINIGAEVLNKIDFTDIPLIISHDLLINNIADCKEKSENHITLPHHNVNQVAILIDKKSFRISPTTIHDNDIIICSEIEIDKSTNLGDKIWLIRTNKILYLGEIKKINDEAIIFFPREDAPFSIMLFDIDFIAPVDTMLTNTPVAVLSETDKLKKLEMQITDLYNRL